ncbi:MULTISPECIES: bifunctional 4-hydroxy-2-oxoglutarate aldolase/2-dehydro-3-deoxy-phosphogluconate aldolase [unclassified Mesotoga]|uniref:bifunctional 4-hydroxy-2-oxoglutarate aldolase/2-dehydro-3-deoxy-phosphogluconate aldolase n=1 Tax=unclassified Mesotoga TaxID=1184398 RepID=UPI000A6E6383|nr:MULTISPECIES: bifunctional 4-hydroxy-2-oxoglutarate aldolase/2-dehydro-3-deoxy-phosphogluconate aldolase [unclassified Mesotoga]MDD3461874.1 bifunctional 4-hydroxy-2-oxoglutarate aldolase/2-dehydro-3-deoxy-phosphogluconate aldolase [Mesotoga sp.]HNS35527.1 bifunctional 4-hydroxy-2-oxoglutarate aldolase/2-dehydro-3-deoxy-phosphogluconate aldolase [Mesotoga sp.]
MLRKLLNEKLLTVIRGLTLQQSKTLCEMLLENGFTIVEVSFSDESSSELLFELKKSLEGVLHIGAGTVYNESSYSKALRSNADFVLSPGFSEEIARLSKRDGMLYIPGVYTSSDVQTALNEGFDFLKLFPGDPIGLQLLKAYRGPFPYVKFMPFGGVTAENAAQYIESGASALGVGSFIASKKLFEEGKESEVLNRIRRIRKAIDGIN